MKIKIKIWNEKTKEYVEQKRFRVDEAYLTTPIIEPLIGKSNNKEKTLEIYIHEVSDEQGRERETNR